MNFYRNLKKVVNEFFCETAQYQKIEWPLLNNFFKFNHLLMFDKT